MDMIIQNEPTEDDKAADMSFTVATEDLRDARAALDGLMEAQGIQSIAWDEQMGKVSVVGAGMRSNPGVAATVFRTLGEQGINIEMISTSPIKISCVVSADRVADAVRALHAAFDLGDDEDGAQTPHGAAR